MSNTIVSNSLGDWCAYLYLWVDEDEQARGMDAYQAKTSIWTTGREVLADGPDYTLSRDLGFAYLYVKATSVTHSLRLFPVNQPGDPLPRFAVKYGDVRVIDGLEENLKFTHMFESLNSDSSNVYLYRFSHGVANPEVDMFWNARCSPDLRLEACHKNRQSFDDRASNILMMQKQAHREYDTVKQKESFLDSVADLCEEDYLMELWIRRGEEMVESGLISNYACLQVS